MSKKIAMRIVRERERNGSFRCGSDLKDVSGLDNDRVNDLKELISYRLPEADILGLLGDESVKNVWDLIDETFMGIKNWFEAKPIQTSSHQSRTRIPTNRPSSAVRSSVKTKDGVTTTSNEKWISDERIHLVAQMEDIDYAALKAVIDVESSGRGFLENGNPKILFEGHVFWRELKSKRINPTQFLETHSDIVYPHWNKRHYRGGTGEYDRLNDAVKIHKRSALRSAAWGMFQIMGFNFKRAGYTSVDEFVKAMYISEEKQLDAFLTFIRNEHLISYIRKKDWTNFAKGYNGNGFKHNRYDMRMDQAYKQYVMV